MKTLLLMTFMVIPFLPYNNFGKLKSSCIQQERLVDQDSYYAELPSRVCDNSKNTTSLKKKQDITISPIYCFAILRKTNFTNSITS